MSTVNCSFIFLFVCFLIGVSAGGGEPPTWTRLSSGKGDLPSPGTSTQQTGCLILDIDKDGLNDIVVTSRSVGSRMVWYRRGEAGWTVFPIDRGLNIEAGGAIADIDGDGDLDLVFGEDYTGSKLYWWENPYPKFAMDTPWTRREIKGSGGQMHHDQIFGDFEGKGVDQLAFWVQRDQELRLADIPRDPSGDRPWSSVQIAKVGPAEGLAKADIDADGKPDLIGGGYWFKHQEGSKFRPILIDKDAVFTRASAGQLVEGGSPEIVFVAGDGVGPLRWFERHDGDWTTHELLSNVVHGHSLDLADVDRDGHLDIFCAEMAQWTEEAKIPDNPQAHMWIFYGDGRGRFVKSLLAVGVDNHESRLADLDGDGDLDIVLKPYTRGAPGIEVWLNSGTGPRLKGSANER
jgi:FG-GAP-like repeat